MPQETKDNSIPIRTLIDGILLRLYEISEEDPISPRGFAARRVAQKLRTVLDSGAFRDLTNALSN